MRISAFGAAMLLLAAACSGGGDEEEAPGTSLTPVSRSLVDIVPATSIGEDGQPVDPTFLFAPEAPQITVVARAGEVTGSPMDITWFQVTDEGEQELFTHTVEVASFETAYSVGENPGEFTPGTYRVEATFEGESLSTQFEVQAPEGASAVGQGVISGPPSSGDSGAVGPPVDPDVGPSQTEIFTTVDFAPVDPDASGITVFVIAGVRGGGGRVEVKATMGGNTRTVSFPTDEGGLVSKILRFDPCVHPGGSDLPGTEATFETTAFQGDTFAASNTDPTTLGPDETPPLLEVTSDPPPGSKVEPGQTITVSIVARETEDGGSWQTGVKQIKLTDFATGAVLGDQVFGEEALPCAQKAWSKGLDVPFTVPEDAPPEINLMAEGFDFAGGRGSFGLSYFTGEVWTGTANIASSAVYPDGATCLDGWDLAFTFAASPEGSIEGQGTAALTSGPTCPFPINVSPFTHVEYLIVGERTAGGFSIRFEPGDVQPSGGQAFLGGFPPTVWCCGVPVEVAVSGSSGTGQGAWEFQSGNPPATYSADGTITLECVTCGEPVG